MIVVSYQTDPTDLSGMEHGMATRVPLFSHSIHIHQRNGVLNRSNRIQAAMIHKMIELHTPTGTDLMENWS